MSGWIKLHRKIQDHWLFSFSEPDKALAFIDLVLSASYQDCTLMIKGRTYQVKKGQFLVSQVTLQKRWKWSQNKVGRFLKLLKNERMLDVETDERTSIITICNYSDYQDGERTNERPNERAGERSGERATDDQTDDIKRNKELKEGEELKKKDICQQTDDCQTVFDYWCEVMGKSGNAKLTTKRKNAVIKRLAEGYTVAHIKQAIDGCKRSPFHMGQNENKTVYDDLELICRDGGNLEKFALNVGAVQNGLSTSIQGYEDFVNEH